MPERPSGPEHEAFFGRRRGKHLRAEQARAVEEILPRLRVPLPPPADLRRLFPRPVEAVRLEIGFGGGEHLIHAARAAPEVGFIGAEPFLNGMAKALLRIAALDLANIRVWDDDARPLLDALPEGQIERVHLHYPDPWPKRRHWKRRFVVDANVARLARIMAPGAELRFATDWPDYAAWALSHLSRAGAFDWRARTSADWLDPWPDWLRTRYEAKAIREGRVPSYLTFVRC